jgi:hypothetical protein
MKRRSILHHHGDLSSCLPVSFGLFGLPVHQAQIAIAVEPTPNHAVLKPLSRLPKPKEADATTASMQFHNPVLLSSPNIAVGQGTALFKPTFIQVHQSHQSFRFPLLE